MSGVAKYRAELELRVDGVDAEIDDPFDIDISLDIDRIPYVQATARVTNLSAEAEDALDPREWPRVLISIYRDVDGLPNDGDSNYTDDDFGQWVLYCTRIVREQDGYTLTLQSGEVRLDAYRRVAPLNWNMGAEFANTRAITEEIVSRVDGFLNSYIGTPAVVTGEPSYWTPGESASDVLGPLLETYGLRIYANSAREFNVAPIGEDTGFGEISTLVIDAGVSLRTFRRTLASDTDLGWYDAVMIAYTWTNSAGATSTTYDRWPTSGANTRALLLKRERPFPGTGAARSIYRRALRRGLTFECELTMIPSVHPGWDVELTDPYNGSELLGYQIKSVEFRPLDGTMTVSIQPPTPEA